MGQLNSLDIRRLTRKEVLFYITIGSTVAYFWWKKRKVTLIQAPPRTSSLTRNGEEYDHRVTVKFEEFNQIVKESKLQLENLEAQVVQLQLKNQELDNISKQKIIEMKRLRQELESAKDDYSELLKKFRQEEQAIRTIKESNENLTKSLLAREKELSIAQKEIYKLREELERARRSSELMVDRMLTDLRSPRENLAKNG
jgi:chromosome segregation ATPase